MESGKQIPELIEMEQQERQKIGQMFGWPE
jgi:hypothetical protein